jgi:hypothetical protein
VAGGHVGPQPRRHVPLFEGGMAEFLVAVFQGAHRASGWLRGPQLRWQDHDLPLDYTRHRVLGAASLESECD